MLSKAIHLYRKPPVYLVSHCLPIGFHWTNQTASWILGNVSHPTLQTIEKMVYTNVLQSSFFLYNGLYMTFQSISQTIPNYLTIY